jgi:hypothetical protein
MTFDGEGEVGVNGTPASNLHVYHNATGTDNGFRIENTVGTNKWIRFFVDDSNGNLNLYSTNQGNTSIGNFNDVTGAYSATSDRSLKKNFENLHFDWKTFMELRPLSYEYKSENNDKRHIGMIAQDVEKIYPEMISYQKEEDVYHMDYSGFGVVAIKAIQELHKDNEELKEELSNLKNLLLEKEQWTLNQNNVIIKHQQLSEEYKVAFKMFEAKIEDYHAAESDKK